jgi:hypothetical protein
VQTLVATIIFFRLSERKWNSNHASISLFDYSEKVFGNLVVVIEVAKVRHTFTTDRGEIYHSGKTYSYHYIEKQDTFSKLLQMIKKE